VRCRCTLLVFCTCRAKKVASRPKPHSTAKVAATGPTPSRSSSRPEIVALDLDARALTALTERGFVVRGTRTSPLLGGELVRLAIPAAIGTDRALRLARERGGAAARNDLYRRMRTVYRPSGETCGGRCEIFSMTAWTEAAGRCSANAVIGVIDTAVDRGHPSLAGVDLTVRTVRSSDRKPSDSDHGTAVVSLLAGAHGSPVAGLAPKARIFAADAFHDADGASSADAFDLVSALDWLAGENVRLINLSLSGPDNAILARAVAAARDRGVRLVAAAGRPEQGSSSGYPARYDGVIAVSAVDGRMRPSRLSTRGSHIAFAAPGVGVPVAVSGGSARLADGTSFAAPFVTAALASVLNSAPVADRSDPLALLAGSARDLGAPGRDPVYGWGLVQFLPLTKC
jgi:hypothetical protein